MRNSHTGWNNFTFCLYMHPLPADISEIINSDISLIIHSCISHFPDKCDPLLQFPLLVSALTWTAWCWLYFQMIVVTLHTHLIHLDRQWLALAQSIYHILLYGTPFFSQLTEGMCHYLLTTQRSKLGKTDIECGLSSAWHDVCAPKSVCFQLKMQKIIDSQLYTASSSFFASWCVCSR